MANAQSAKILDLALQKALKRLTRPVVRDAGVLERVELIARNPQNRACARFVLACALAKVDRPEVDIRKPYTEIGTADAFFGRTYDELYLTEFIARHALPCNVTTAFLTPAFRNRNVVLTPEVNLVGRPASVHQATLQLLDDVFQEKLTAHNLLVEMLRWLVLVREEKQQRMQSLLAGLRAVRDETALPAEVIVKLIEHHLKLKHTSRLPVLVVVAAYQAAGQALGEQVLPLHGHNAADRQTGSVGDVEIALQDDQHIITCYEMKTRPILASDLDQAVEKALRANPPIQHYVFITTTAVDPEVLAQASAMYDRTGLDMVILDCLGFLRHFLHFFYRARMRFLAAYQALVLAEPESAVSQPLKEAFLVLRQAAETQDT